MQGILVSIIDKTKLFRQKINKPTDGNINAYKNYCNIFNKLKRSAKTKYYTDMLNLHMDSIKKAWLVLDKP